MGYIPQLKDTGKLDRVKTHQCAVFQRPISHAKTDIASNKGLEEYLQANEWKKKKGKGN